MNSMEIDQSVENVDDLEDRLVKRIQASAGTEAYNSLVQYLKFMRSKYRDSLENSDDPIIRGRVQECRDIIAIIANIS